ncbi:MAG: RNA polymerase sigma factor [Gemmatimonadota bacterium]
MNANPTGERALMVRAQAGDRGAFGALIEMHMQSAYRVALGLVGSHEDALDLSQEAFARAFRARATLDPERPFFPWLYQVVRRLCLNELRDSGNRRRLAEGEGRWLVERIHGRVGDGPSEAAERSELRDQIEAAVERLTEREREVFVLREFGQRSYKEISELAGIPIGTVMSRLYAARKRLAAELEVLQ